MNLRHQANSLLVTIQISLASGEWIDGEEQIREMADSLEEALFDMRPASEIRVIHDRLADLAGAGVSLGNWSGEWCQRRSPLPHLPARNICRLAA